MSAMSRTNRFRRRSTTRWAADPHVLLAIAIAISALSIELIVRPLDAYPVAVPCLALLLIQLVLSSARRQPDIVPADTARLLIAIVAVFWMSVLTADQGTFPLAVLYVPIVTMGAAMGATELVVLGVAAVVAFVLSVLPYPAIYPEMLQRGAALLATTTVLAVGTRRTIRSLERALDHLRRSAAAQRRRARQMAAIEEVGHALAADGPTSDTLDRAMDVLAGRFGYRYVSIYTIDGEILRLGAQRGYATPIDTFDGRTGVVGRVMRERRPALVTDVGADPDYTAADSEVRSEVSVPLLVGESLIGVLNVESDRDPPLDESDRDTMVVVGDRIAAALALAREREALADRAELFGRLVAFGTEITTSLEAESAYDTIVGAVRRVLRVDAVGLVLRDPATGDDRLVGQVGGDERFLGVRIPPGEGATGRAIAEGRLIVDQALTRAAFPSTMRSARSADAIVSAAIPLVHDGQTTGALAVTREDLGRPFTALELETLPVMASQVALAIANIALHAQVAEAAIRDPLTGLWNRRQLDVSLVRLFAARDRLDPDERRPLAAIIFDLDHFGQFNKRHGHAVGDTVLRGFGSILSGRLRASDLVARLGGEEFVAVLDGANLDEAQRVAEEIRRALELLPVPGADGQVLHATVSAGCSALGPNVASAEVLFEVADVALQMAKRAGRNQVVAA